MMHDLQIIYKLATYQDIPAVSAEPNHIYSYN